ncbi:MAG: monofunctional biosynthetic peptidoglycan transglycosylase [Pseudomonadota bacterium]
MSRSRADKSSDQESEGKNARKKSPGRKRKKSKPKKRSRLFHAFKWLFILGFVLAAIPVVLSLIYMHPSVHPVSTLMLGRMVTGQTVERNWVPLSDIDIDLKHAVVMSEDGQFCNHRGIDWRELNQVIDNALEGERTRGASTITMQLAKNLFLWPGRSYVRKALEVPLAVMIDALWSKKRILEIYLNVVEWGDGVFGIDAAMKNYFNGTASRVNVRQAALLAVTLPSPATRNPAKPRRSDQRRAKRVQRLARVASRYSRCLK